MELRAARFSAVAITLVLLAGCLVDSDAEAPAYVAAADAVRASGLDPSQLLLFGDHAALVHRDADHVIGMTAWRHEARGWTFDGGSSQTRDGVLRDAVIMGGPISTSWQVGYIYGFLPPGVASIESTDFPDAVAEVAESGAYVLVLGELSDPNLRTPQEITWQMRDRAGRLVREGTGDCCPESE
jgi:hypothetical protein